MPAIDWSGAEVRGAELTVPLTGKAPKAWRERAAAVVERRGRDGVEIKKGRLVVGGVERGGEPELRHLLESAVMQANADLGEQADEEPADEASEADREMTAAFRAFG